MSEEAEWCFGFPWLSIIYNKWANTMPRTSPLPTGQEDNTKKEWDEINEDTKKAQEYLQKSFKIIHKDQVPELYYSDSDKPNDNTPLGWAESLFIVALLKTGK